MINFWRKKEAAQSKTEQSEDMSMETESVENMTVPAEKPVDFRDNLKTLNEAMQIQRELGGQLAPADVERITGMKLEEFHSFLAGQEVSIETNGAKLVEEIESLFKSLDKEAATESSLMHRLANNPAVRASFVALMLFAKFAPETAAAANTKIDSNSFEMAKDITSE
ncbi:MAG: hypothetical protein CVU67_07505, partial [Deltaproteobacteria bacterium HGW-Deltaproteobacteria-24]